ncbi:MAG: hypothetical protein ACFE78_06395 [Candidatus Hodarchaeota archaeon]
MSLYNINPQSSKSQIGRNKIEQNDVRKNAMKKVPSLIYKYLKSGLIIKSERENLLNACGGKSKSCITNIVVLNVKKLNIIARYKMRVGLISLLNSRNPYSGFFLKIFNSLFILNSIWTRYGEMAKNNK